jgi:threonine dehydrogenase-like Zn-dependent dehydrogenase
MNEFYPGPFPVVLGHEVVGQVVSIGPKVKNFAPGDRVFRQRLWDCHVTGGGRSCWGGFAEYGLVTDEWAKRRIPYGPESLPHAQQKLLAPIEPVLAAGMVTLMETLDCVATCGAAPGKSVAIVGSGPVGQAFALFAKLLGASPVMAFGRRKEAAERFHSVCRADGYVTGNAFPPEVQRIIRNGGFNIVLEAVGSEEALETCLRLAGTKGQVCLYGIAPESNPFPDNKTKQPNVKVIGAVEGRAQAKLLSLIESGQVLMNDWVTCHMPMSEYQRAFDMVSSKQALKVVLSRV